MSATIISIVFVVLSSYQSMNGCIQSQPYKPISSANSTGTGFGPITWGQGNRNTSCLLTIDWRMHQSTVTLLVDIFVETKIEILTTDM